MFCLSCIKLVFLPLEKRCARCQGAVKKNIAVLCETCSVREKMCESCLKRIFGTVDNPHNRHMLSGCGTCGGQKGR